MKGIIKVRSFDSLKKLNYKRAKGKSVNIKSLNSLTDRTIITLEKLDLLTPELLWELIERKKYFNIEEYKLEWLMERRRKSLPLSPEGMEAYVNHFSDVKIAVLRIPYEIRIIGEYKNYIYKREKDENEQNTVS
jgi:hypothetical protein